MKTAIKQRIEEFAQQSALVSFEKDLQTVINLCEEVAKEGHFKINITDAVIDPMLVGFVSCNINLRNVRKIGEALTKQGLSTSIRFDYKNYQMRIS